MFAAILATTLSKYNITFPDILGASAAGGYSIPFAVAGIAGGWITMDMNGCDLSRQIKRVENYDKLGFFSRNRRSIIGQVLGLMLVGTLTLMVGMVTGITSGLWDINEVVQDLFTGNITRILCFLAIIFAQWSTNTTANLMPPSLVMLNIFPKMSFGLSTIICGTLSIAVMPWKLAETNSFLVDVQYWTSQLLGPVIGILLVDYFVIRKCKLNVRDLFISGGQYTYQSGFNLSAIAALVSAFVISFFGGDYSFFVGLGSSTILYYLFMTFGTLRSMSRILAR